MRGLPSRMHVSGLELMGALGRLTFCSWSLINVENLVCQKNNALGVLRVGLDGMVGMGKATVGFGGSCGKSSNYYLRSLFFVPFFLSS